MAVRQRGAKGCCMLCPLLMPATLTPVPITSLQQQLRQARTWQPAKKGTKRVSNQAPVGSATGCSARYILKSITPVLQALLGVATRGRCYLLLTQPETGFRVTKLLCSKNGSAAIVCVAIEKLLSLQPRPPDLIYLESTEQHAHAPCKTIYPPATPKPPKPTRATRN